MEVRTATDNDIVGIVYVQATSWIKNYANPLAKINEEDVRSIDFTSKLSEWQHILKSSSYRVWVACEGTTVVGFIAARRDGKSAEIYQQHTLPERVGQGIGSQLLSRALDWLENAAVSLRIPAYLQTSLDFYTERGFSVDPADEIDFIRLPSGKQIPTLLLRLGAKPVPDPLASAIAPKPSSTQPAESTGKPRLVSRAKLAQATGVRPSTIKYYTEVGILPFEQAETGLARRYRHSEAAARLKAIRKLRAQGLSISQIKVHFDSGSN